MNVVFTVLHIVACIFLIVVVLLQTGKGADIGAVFGGSSQTIFGSSGASNLLTKLTTWTAAVFMATSLFLTWQSSHHLTVSIADQVPAEPPPLAAPAPEPSVAAPAASAADTSADARPGAAETSRPDASEAERATDGAREARAADVAEPGAADEPAAAADDRPATDDHGEAAPAEAAGP